MFSYNALPSLCALGFNTLKLTAKKKQEFSQSEAEKRENMIKLLFINNFLQTLIKTSVKFKEFS